MAEAFAPFHPLWYQLALVALLAFALSLVLADFLAAWTRHGAIAGLENQDGFYLSMQASF